ncbi:unnamed protein product [Calicophoron daubneyi]|uniref:Ferritin n=1 Tax=Calicophoron daubneyi TaxID=300641 RepID=A0AAV2TR26_CALDB
MQSSRINYAPECEQTINQVIQVLESVSHSYDQLSAACISDEISLAGFSKYYSFCAMRARRLAQQWIHWQTLRGGKLNINEVKPLVQSSEISHQGIEKIAQQSVELEVKVEQVLRQLHHVARSKDDVATTEIIEEYMQSHYGVIRMMVNHVNGLRISQNVFLYDRLTMLPLVKKIRKLVKHQTQYETEFLCPEQHTKKQYTQFSVSTGTKAFVYPMFI